MKYQFTATLPWQDGVGPTTDLYEGMAADRPIAYRGDVVGAVKSWQKTADGLRIQAWVDTQLSKQQEYFTELLRRAKAGTLSATPAFLRYAARMAGDEVKSWPWLGVQVTDQPQGEMAVWTQPEAEQAYKIAGLKMSLPTALRGATAGLYYFKRIPSEDVPGLLHLRVTRAGHACAEHLGLPGARLKWVYPCARDEADYALPADYIGFANSQEPNTIFISATAPEDQAVALVAHELRHLWQFANGDEPSEEDANNYAEAFCEDWERGWRG